MFAAEFCALLDEPAGPGVDVTYFSHAASSSKDIRAVCEGGPALSGGHRDIAQALTPGMANWTIFRVLADDVPEPAPGDEIIYRGRTYYVVTYVPEGPCWVLHASTDQRSIAGGW